MTKKHEIIKLSDREHIIHRPSMYIGGVAPDAVQDYAIQSNGDLQNVILNYPPGLIKIINEVIDNSIDAILKTQVGNLVEVEITDNTVQVQDNSSGFPTKSKDSTEEPLVLALGNARAGSNFNDEDNIGQMGTNGVGAFATNCFSLEFQAISSNQDVKVQATWTNNAILKEVKTSKPGAKTGTLISCTPDLKKFNLGKIDEDIKIAIKTRLICLAYTYPNIKFKFNKELLHKPKQITDLLNLGDDPVVHYQGENYEVHVIARNDTHQNFSFINGLNIKDGGTHLDVIANDLAKAFSTARGIQASKADITNTLQLVFVGTKFKNLRFNSQTKEKITNSTAEVRAYLGDIEPLVQKVLKSKEIKDFIKATAQARELRANKSKLNQTKKAKIKSEDFLDAQETRKYLMLVEGESAKGGLLPALGRKEIAYYTLMGKPLNAWSSSMQKMMANRELSEVLNIIHNSDFEKVVLAQDADLDGKHIAGLLLGFFAKYLPEYQDKIYYLRTPVRVVEKDDEAVRWSFNIDDDMIVKSNERALYMKGLGSFETSSLIKIVEQEGFENLLCKVQMDLTSEEDLETLEAWLGKESQQRKDFILENDFNIAKI